jgi:hypothetical protein
MKTLKLLFAALVILLSTSCKKEDIQTQKQNEGSQFRLEFENVGHTNINVQYTNVNGDHIHIHKTSSSSPGFTFRVNGINHPNGVDVSTYKSHGIHYIKGMAVRIDDNISYAYNYNGYLNDGGDTGIKDLAIDIRKVDTNQPISISAGCYISPFSYGSFASTNYYLYKDGQFMEAKYTTQFKYNN